MAKVLKIVGAVVAIAGLAIVTGGAAAGLAFGTLLSTSVAGISAGALLAAGTVISAAGSLLAPRPKAPDVSTNNADRLTASIDLRAARKIIFGTTAMATDIRDQEFTDSQGFLHRWVVVASHKVNAISQIWFDDKLAWSASGGVTSDFAGYLTVTPVLEGSAANAINISARMGSSRRYTGCAYVYFRYKLTGNTKKTASPFAQSIPSRITIKGNGAPTYDVRLDSTRGGSGAHRADDQTTWTWSSDGSRNPALCLLWYMLGWRIQNPVTGVWKLAVGKGIPPARIDFDSFITAANLCDEPVGRSAGGTEPRYRCDGIFGENDDPVLVLDSLKACMNAVLDDVDGKIRLTVLHNDLGSPIGNLTTHDVLGEFRWDQTPPLSDTFNIIRGGYTDASEASLFQLVDGPDQSFPSPDGIDRIETINLPLVQSSNQRARLLKQRLQRMLYSGTFSAEFQATAWKFQKGDVIRLTFTPLGFDAKLFRIADMAIRVDGVVPMVLREEHPDIYQWDDDEPAAVVGAEPTRYDPLLSAVAQGIDDAAGTAVWNNITGDGKPDDGATVGATAGTNLFRTDGTTIMTQGEVRTVEGIAAAIAGQGALATQDTVNLASDATGELPPELASPTLRNSQITISDGGALSGAGGGSVTFSGLGGGDVGLQDEVFFGQGTFRESSAGPVATRAQYRTDQGTAAAIVGQTGWATYGEFSPNAVAKPGSNLVYDGGLTLGGARWSMDAGWNVFLTGDVGWVAGISGTVSSAKGFYSDYFKLNASSAYSMTLDWGGSGTVSFFGYINWYNSSFAYISSSSSISPTMDIGFVRDTLTATSPSGAAFGQIILLATSISSGGQVLVKKIKCEVGSIISPFNDDATNGAAYANGQDIDALKPGEIGANVTETRTAGAIAGQTAWATYAEFTPTGVAKPGSNLVYDGGLALGGARWSMDAGWNVFLNGDVGWVAGISGTVSSAKGFYSDYFKLNASSAYSMTLDWGGSGTVSFFGYINWYNSSFAYISSSSSISPTMDIGFVRDTLTATSPSGAAFGQIILLATSISSGGQVLVKKIKCEVGSIISPFNDDATNGAAYANGQHIDALKPAEIGANVTETRIAGGFLGQTAWASYTGAIGALASRNDVGTQQIIASSVHKSAYAKLTSNINVSATGGANVETIFNVSFTKDLAGSAIEAICYGTFSSADDVGFDATAFIDGVQVQTGGVNLTFDGGSSAGKVMQTLFFFLEGLAAGSHTLTIEIVNNKTSAALVVQSGATLKLTEVKPGAM